MSGSIEKTVSVLGWTGILWLDSLRGIPLVRRAPSFIGWYCHRQRRDGNGGQAVGKMCTNIGGDLSFGLVQGCGDVCRDVGHPLCVGDDVLVDLGDFPREMLGVVLYKMVVQQDIRDSLVCLDKLDLLPEHKPAKSLISGLGGHPRVIVGEHLPPRLTCLPSCSIAPRCMEHR
jgi:hypothetical protein